MGKNIILTEEQLGNIINRLKPINESEITEGSDGNYMAKQQLFMIATLAHKMWEMMEDGEELDDWMESKIAQCDASITSVVKAYLYGEVEEKQKGMDGLAYDDLVIGTCNFEVEFSNCTLPFEFKNLTTNIVSLSFSPKIIRSPKDLGISDDTRNLGFGLKNNPQLIHCTLDSCFFNIVPSVVKDIFLDIFNSITLLDLQTQQLIFIFLFIFKYKKVD